MEYSLDESVGIRGDRLICNIYKISRMRVSFFESFLRSVISRKLKRGWCNLPYIYQAYKQNILIQILCFILYYTNHNLPFILFYFSYKITKFKIEKIIHMTYLNWLSITWSTKNRINDFILKYTIQIQIYIYIHTYRKKKFT